MIQDLATSTESTWQRTLEVGAAFLAHPEKQRKRGNPDNPGVRAILRTSCPYFIRPQFWGRKWLRQFYGRLVFFGSFCWRNPMPIKFLVLGGQGFWGAGGVGGSGNYIFMGAGIFPTEEHVAHLDVSWQKLSSHFLAKTLDSQSPSPKLSLKMPLHFNSKWPLRWGQLRDNWETNIGSLQSHHLVLWLYCPATGHPPRPEIRGVLRQIWCKSGNLVAPCSWELYRGRARGWESRPGRFCFALVLKGFSHYSTTIVRLSPLSGLERGGWELLPVWGWEIGRNCPSPSFVLCLCSADRTEHFLKGRKGQKVPRKEEEGWPAKGVKGKRTRKNRSVFHKKFSKQIFRANFALQMFLVTWPKYPPYRETGLAIPLLNYLEKD